ncbi:MAG: FtsX-like permease family protein [Oscillospiraceae bacterium]|nr:FtsX-like permease family protein [Oscillospiraceae bacterium]
MFSHGFMSFAAIGITVACLLIMGTFTLVAVNANAMLEDMESQNQMLAFVDKGLSEQEAKALAAELLAVENVSQVTFISNVEAAAAFRERYEDDELFQGLPDENFRHRYAIDLEDIGYMGKTKAALEAVPGIGPGNVSAYEDEAAGFITIRNVAGIVCAVLIAVLFVVSVFIIANTIKLTTFDRRDEIAIMKMVGATNGFIRWPFVYEGFLLGLFSAVIGFFLQWGLYEAVARSVASNDTINLITVVPFETMWTYVAMIFAVAGMVIGVGGSLSAIRKFLQV